MFNFIKSELEHFKSLPKKAQTLLISFFFYSAAYPIISVFINAFIWKYNNSISSLIYLRIGQFIVVPIFFMITGLLLKKINIKILYFVGSIGIALACLTTVFWKNETSTDFLILGALLGVGIGFYWSSRNYLTVKETDDENRGYFFGLLFSFATLIGLVVTLFTGWFIVFGLSFKLLIAIAFLLLFWSGFIVFKNNYETPNIGNLFIVNSSYLWIKKRIIHFGIGLVDGPSFFLPGLLILVVLGNEGVLGTLTAISSVFSTMLIYLYGRKSHANDHKRYFIISAILGLILSLLIAAVFNKFTVIIYSLFNGLIINFLWLTVSPPVMKNIDLEVGEVEGKRFSYILDTEFFLNVGRVFALIACLFIAKKYGAEFTLRYSMLILSCLQILLFIYIEKFRKSD